MAICSEPGCPVVVDKAGPCPTHAGQRDRRRGTARERGYDTRWEEAAATFKVRYPLCGMRPHGQAPVMSRCHEQGRATPVYQVDHVVPHRQDERLFWDMEGNWQSLCRECGARKSAVGL